MGSVKKTLVLILVLISIIVLGLRFGGQISSQIFHIKEKAGIRVLSIPTGAEVTLNGKSVGKTPFEDQDLVAEDIDVQIKSGDMVWQSKIKLIPGTLTVVNRELTKDSSSSAGELLTLEKGTGATIISSPSGADVEIDGQDYGKTPVSVDIKEGEHTFALKKGNYLNRSIRAFVPANYNLVLNVDLALSEADLSNITTIPITETPKVIVKSTPTGFLRVRDKADLTGKEVAQVKPGDELVLLEELETWDRVRLLDGKEGYVSKTYVEKKQTTP